MVAESERCLVADDLSKPRNIGRRNPSLSKHPADDRTRIAERSVGRRQRRKSIHPGHVVDTRDDAAPDASQEDFGRIGRHRSILPDDWAGRPPLPLNHQLCERPV